MTRARRAALLLFAAALLAGCAGLPQGNEGGVSSEVLAGRLAIRVDAGGGEPARSLSAAFELLGNPQSGQLNLSTPLGSVLAQAHWAPGRVVLVTPQGETAFADLDTLTRDVLGESVPVPALFDWLRGRPWPGAPSNGSVAPAEPGFDQLGWNIGLARFGEGWVVARRALAPVVVVRAKLD